jgi:hypothetical protein
MQTSRPRDFSDDLMKPLDRYSIFRFSALTEDHLMQLCQPLFIGVEALLDVRTPTFERLFAILATVLNFGQHLSDAASLYTSVHGPVLDRLAKFVTSVMAWLSYSLFAQIAGSVLQDGFIFADEEATSVVVAQTRAAVENCAAFGLPEQLVQVIVVETCKQCDARIFNVIIETSDIFTNEKITQMLHNIRMLQGAFNCVSRNFQIAFPCLLDMILKTQALWSAVGRIPGTPLMRSIIERCVPEITLPRGVTLDDIGQKCPRFQLKVDEPSFSFAFTFEWLWLQYRGHAPGIA